MNTIHFAVIGAGGFAQFAVEQFIRVPGCKLVGVYDQDDLQAKKLKASIQFGPKEELIQKLFLPKIESFIVSILF